MRLRLRDWPLGVRLAAIVFAVSVVPVAVLATLTTREARSRTFEGQTDLLGARADQLADNLDQFHRMYAGAAARLARAPEVTAALAAPDAAPRDRALAAHLTHLRTGDPAIAHIGLVGRTGRIVAATEPSEVGAERAERGYVREGLRGRPLISPPFIAESGTALIAYVAPVPHADRSVAGLAVYWVRAEALWDVARASNGLAGEGSYAVLLDQHGIRVAHTFSRGVMFRPAGPLPAELIEQLVAERRFGPATRAILHEVYPFPEQLARARAAEVDRGLFRGVAPATGAMSYGVARRLRTAPWTVFYMIAERALVEPLDAMTRWMLVASAIVGVLALATGAFAAAAFLRPVRRLGRAASRVADNELAVRVDADRRDELGAVGAAFNAMAERLQANAAEVQRTRDQLEALVEERTAQLSASEQKYRDLFEHAPDMHLTAAQPCGTIVDVNETLCARLGYAKDELIGRPFHAVYHEDDLIEVARHRATMEAAGKLVDVERRLRRKDGSSIDVSLELRLVRNADGRPTEARAIWRDISRRKQDERDRQFLVELGEGLRSSTDVTEVLAEVAAQLGRYLRVERCTFADVDQALDAVVLRRQYHDGAPPLPGVLAVSAFAPATTEAAARGDVVVVRDTAADARTAARYAAVYGPAAVGALIAVPLMRERGWRGALAVLAVRPRAWEEREIALVRLVAERVWSWAEHLRVLAALRETAVEAAVRSGEQRFRALVENVHDHAMFMLDPNGRITSWNAGATRLLGYEADEVLGRTGTQLSIDPGAELQVLLDQARAHGRAEHEAWRVRKDGSRFWANVILCAVRAADGTLEGFAKVTRDFTEHRRHQEALRAKHAELAQSLREREVLLQEVHHRVKNNLQVISSLINMQVRRLPTGGPRDALEECQTRILAIALIHEKLYQSKDYAQVAFADYARSLAANVVRATGTSCAIALDLAIEDVPLGVDRAIPCGLVINELITNSLKHGFRDGRRGTIRVELRRVGEARLRLCVADDGVGLPAGLDLHEVRTMGLQLVATLAEQLGAELVVEGGAGARFQLTFPEAA